MLRRLFAKAIANKKIGGSFSIIVYRPSELTSASSKNCRMQIEAGNREHRERAPSRIRADAAPLNAFAHETGRRHNFARVGWARDVTDGSKSRNDGEAPALSSRDEHRVSSALARMPS